MYCSNQYVSGTLYQRRRYFPQPNQRQLQCCGPSSLHAANVESEKKPPSSIDSQSDYSNKLREVFKEKLFIEDGGIVEEFDLAAPDFDAETAMNNIRDKGADTVVLFHNHGILETALEVVKANTTQLPILIWR